ncbi:tannase/feruloyl esterase family alpha/beta hydrolase [Altererythrobacter xixiisoli]|uniref:Tannase/feruloyl esterase family alpha/beta hydrolase n=2 Tax=Croceibacterium xixiisoli TaxID=1476466 RepID=A0A6I4TUP0_9SPHN|nr:tannase/feruloyl esterase family alpha/beta hydrolase [Croceibacterium xixiisoli]
MRMKRAVLFAPLLATAAVAQSPAAPADTMSEVQCKAMASFQLRPGVTIISAKLIPATSGSAAPGPGAPPTPALPAHCMVEGTIDPHTGADGTAYAIGFALALPSEWNGRFLMQGGGGLNGSVRPPIGAAAAGRVPALARGFAVISHDSGHKGEGFDDSFMADQRAGLDFAMSSVPTVTIAGKALTEHFYGRSIAHSYMAGCSTGGRESMLASQRHPEMFDGIVVGAPAMRTGHSNLGTGFAKVQFNQAAPRDAQGLPLSEQAFSPADRQTIHAGLLQQCDALDGRADGIITNVAQCHFRPAALQCSAAKQDGCLSGDQVGALERAFAGPKDAAGNPAYASFPWDTGVTDISGPVSGFIVSGKADVLGPANRDLTFDVDGRLQQIRSDGVQTLTDTNVWTDLDTFLGRGGKILYYHGVSDAWFSAFDSWDYWQRAAERNGQSFTDASRFYMIPGMAHCRGGDSFGSFDLLGAVVDWVEKGQAPESVIAHRESGEPGERPLCPHPSYAHYTGGDPLKAGSYQCRQPSAS